MEANLYQCEYLQIPDSSLFINKLHNPREPNTKSKPNSSSSAINKTKRHPPFLLTQGASVLTNTSPGHATLVGFILMGYLAV
jgi:hypothetical protein